MAAVCPKIYAYELPGVSTHRGYVKVGYTEREVEARVREQVKTAAVAYRILGAWSAVRNDGSVFTDHDVHAVLRREGFPQLKAGAARNEWFRCSPDDVRAAVVELQTGLVGDGRRTQTFSMRPEQAAAVRTTVDYYRAIARERTGKIPRFLWNAKMRFGKTFAAYQLAREMKIEGFRSLNADIRTIINKSEAVKKAKRERDELTKRERKELSEEEKEYKSLRKRIQEKLIKFATRVPVFMYLTDYREYSLKDVVTKLESVLFRKVTGLKVRDFELPVSLNVFNESLMNDAVYKFKRYEDASLTYTGIDRHAEDASVGLYSTTISRADYAALAGGV